MLFLSLISALAMAGSADVAAAADPLAPARDGQWQCYVPNRTTRTCQSMAGYKDNGDGTYANTATVLLSPQQAVTMTTVSSVHITGSAVCGTILQADIDAAQISVSGQVLPPEQARPVLAQISQALASFVGHEVCTSYIPAGDGFSSQVTLDGVARPDFTQAVIWVSPSDGYSVAP